MNGFGFRQGIWLALLTAAACAHNLDSTNPSSDYDSPSERPANDSANQKPPEIVALEKRVAVLEARELKRSNPSTSEEGPVAGRAAKLRAAADLLDKADEARRQGDTAAAQSFFQAASKEIGPSPLAELEPVFRSSATEPSGAATGQAKAGATAMKPRPKGARSDKASLDGSVALLGPYASMGGMGVVLLAPIAGKVPAAPQHLVMEQRNRDFTPHLLMVPVGSTVSFPNYDPVFHNLFSLSDAKSFDLGVYKSGESRDVVFDRAGIVRILCNLHASMNAFVVVHDEPYGSVIDKSGHFSFKELGAGKYKLRAWHERSEQLVSRDVTLEPGVNHLDLSLAADLAPSLGPNKLGKPRGPQPHN
jgi:plastocyanin